MHINHADKRGATPTVYKKKNHLADLTEWGAKKGKGPVKGKGFGQEPCWEKKKRGTAECGST